MNATTHTFLTDTDSVQLRNVLLAREAADPDSNMYKTYTDLLHRLTDVAVVQYVEIAVNNHNANRKDLFVRTRKIQSEFINDRSFVNQHAADEDLARSYIMTMLDRIDAEIYPPTQKVVNPETSSAEEELQGLLKRAAEVHQLISNFFTQHTVHIA